MRTGHAGVRLQTSDSYVAQGLLQVELSVWTDRSSSRVWPGWGGLPVYSLTFCGTAQPALHDASGLVGGVGKLDIRPWLLYRMGSARTKRRRRGRRRGRGGSPASLGPPWNPLQVFGLGCAVRDGSLVRMEDGGWRVDHGLIAQKRARVFQTT